MATDLTHPALRAPLQGGDVTENAAIKSYLELTFICFIPVF